MVIPNTDAIYWVVESERETAKRIDSMMIEPLHNIGKTIIKLWLDPDQTQEWLYPEDEIPEDFIQKSEYGMVVKLDVKLEGGN